ncbi:Actin- protein 10 [Aphanomyces cochlioides]|nr:Actin- protein 10 [Aphanomyces cochlioides]
MMNTVEKSAIVLDVGSRYLKCGMSGERSPRTFLRWEVAELLQIQPPLTKAAWQEYVGEILYDICFKHLRVASKNRRLVVCEDLLFPRNLREALVEIVFNVLKAKQLVLLPAMTAALYATCHTTALIVDAGWHETRILPVFEQVPLLHAYTTTGLASRSSCDAIVQQVGAKDRTAEDILERACFIAPDDMIDEAQDAHFFAMTPHALTIPAKTRSEVVETLFSGSEVDGSIPDAIEQCLSKCPVDTRRALRSNILCIGGTSMLPGFRDKLAKRLTDAKLVQTYFPSHLMSWIGASIYGSTEAAQTHAISADSFVDGSSVQDWMAV